MSEPTTTQELGQPPRKTAVRRPALVNYQDPVTAAQLIIRSNDLSTAHR